LVEPHTNIANPKICAFPSPPIDGCWSLVIQAMAGDKINALVLLLSLVGPTLSTAAPQQPWQVGEVVQTSSGPVKGHASREVPSVSEYLGINYAQAPVGNLRWALPVPFKGSGVVNADKFGA
jgi:hypothetical protein